MEETTFITGNKLRNDIAECKGLIDRLEMHRDSHAIQIVNYYVADRERYKSKVILQLEGDESEEQNEAFQFFLDTILTLEDKKLERLEKEFAEL